MACCSLRAVMNRVRCVRHLGAAVYPPASDDVGSGAGAGRCPSGLLRRRDNRRSGLSMRVGRPNGASEGESGGGAGGHAFHRCKPRDMAAILIFSSPAPAPAKRNWESALGGSEGLGGCPKAPFVATNVRTPRAVAMVAHRLHNYVVGSTMEEGWRHSRGPGSGEHEESPLSNQCRR